MSIQKNNMQATASVSVDNNKKLFSGSNLRSSFQKILGKAKTSDSTNKTAGDDAQGSISREHFKNNLTKVNNVNQKTGESPDVKAEENISFNMDDYADMAKDSGATKETLDALTDLMSNLDSPDAMDKMEKLAKQFGINIALPDQNEIAQNNQPNQDNNNESQTDNNHQSNLFAQDNKKDDLKTTMSDIKHSEGLNVDIGSSDAGLQG